jgi:hypothetical protein
MWEWVCNLQLQLVLASAVFVGSELRGTNDNISPSKFWDYPNLEGQAPVHISTINTVAHLYSQVRVNSLYVLMTDGSFCIASARTELKAPLPLLCVLSVSVKQLVHRAVP